MVMDKRLSREHNFRLPKVANTHKSGSFVNDDQHLGSNLHRYQKQSKGLANSKQNLQKLDKGFPAASPNPIQQKSMNKQNKSILD